LFQATHDKVLWIHLLKHLLDEIDTPLPPYGKVLEFLEHAHIEAITLRAAHLAVSWNNETLKPRSVVRLDMGRSVTWLRLVCARSLFVGSSETVSSSLACWDLATALKGDKKPIAECFFSVPVRSATFEVQEGAAVIAVAVDSPHSHLRHSLNLSTTPVVEIITLRQYRGRYVFV
jgi:hypothetical protein